MKIKKLPSIIANQIAAGEVIERPASVIKELLENSLDAGAKQIDITIKQGGSELIRIRDNGHGIDEDDLELAISSHATSKIVELDDLQHIASLGFRGEALSSVSSVSRFSLTSRPEQQETAFEIQLDGRSETPSVKPAAHPIGTTIEVRDLFFNTPARRKFLRAEKTELFHIEEVVKRIALSRYDVGFTLQHDQKTLLNLRPAQDLAAKERRVAKICGSQFLQHATTIDVAASGLQLTGWMALPSFFRSQADLQYFYLNGRMIKDRMISHALRQAYRDHLYEGRQPAYVLYLECDPELVDVNVHPTKHEVRFQESRLVHDFLFSRLYGMLSEAAQGESLDVGSEDDDRDVSNDLRYQIPTRLPLQVRQPARSYGVSTNHHSAPNHRTGAACCAPTDVSHALGKVIGTLHDEYILAENTQGLVIVNIVKATQAITLTKLKQTYPNIQPQPLLVPETITLPKNLILIAESAAKQLQQYGFHIEHLGEENIIIRKQPALLRNADIKTLISNLLTAIEKQFPPEETLSLIASAASKPKQLSKEDMHRLLRELEVLDIPSQLGDTEVWRCISLEKL